MNILVVHIRFAEYDRCSGDLRLTNMLRILAERHAVGLHILYKPASYVAAAGNANYLGLMTRLGIEVTTGSLRTQLRRRRYDAVLIEFWYVARHIIDEIRALQPDARVIVDTEHLYFPSNRLRALTEGKDPDAPGLLAAKKDELDTYARADLVVTTTDEDKTVLAGENQTSSTAAATIPNIHDIPAVEESAPRRANSLVFVGSFANNPANVDGIVHFCAEALPLVRSRIPGIALTIVGNKPPAAVQQLASDFVTVTGYVPEVEPYLAANLVSICPIRFGSGLKGKITQAMMHGLPVVTTSIGAQGLDARHGEEIMLGDTPDEFARCVTDLLQQPELRTKVSRKGRDLVIRHYSYAAVAASIDDILAGVRARPPKRLPQPKRLSLKLRFGFIDLMHRHVLWRFRRSAGQVPGELT